jgi:hypothetical protein
MFGLLAHVVYLLLLERIVTHNNYIDQLHIIVFYNLPPCLNNARVLK